MISLILRLNWENYDFQLALRPSQLDLRPSQLDLRPSQLAPRPYQLALRPSRLTLSPSQLDPDQRTRGPYFHSSIFVKGPLFDSLTKMKEIRHNRIFFCLIYLQVQVDIVWFLVSASILVDPLPLPTLR